MMNNFNKRLKKLIEDKPASFQGPSHYTRKQRDKWNTIMHTPTMVNGEPVWNTAEKATEIVDNDTEEVDNGTKVVQKQPVRKVKTS